MTALTVRVGDRIEEGASAVHPQHPERTFEVLALKYGFKNNKGWYMQLRNVKGSKKFWAPVSMLFNTDLFRHYKPLERR